MLAEATRSATGSGTREDRSYRSFLTFEGQRDAIDHALQQVDAWLRGKRYDVDVRTSGYYPLPNGEVVVVHHDLKLATAFRVRLTETDNHGEQWLSSIAMWADRRGGWVSIRVSHTGGKPAKRPGIARALVEALELRDSTYALRTGAPVLRPDDVPDLVEAVTDPGRTGLLFVAATEAGAPDMVTGFVERAQVWARGIDGIAQMVVLDPPATEAFNAAMGRSHEAPPWTIRTYQTRVDPERPGDRRRHRILGTARLAGQDRDVTSLLEHVARSHSSTTSLPSAAAQVLRGLNRVEDRLLLDTAFGPAPTPDASAPTAPVQGVPAPRPVSPPAGPVPTPPAPPRDRPASTPASPATTPEPAVDPATGPDRTDRTDSLLDEVARLQQQVDAAAAALGVPDLSPAAIEEAIARLAAPPTPPAAAPARPEPADPASDRVRRELGERQRRIDELEDALQAVQNLADDAQIEWQEAEERAVEAADESRWLRGELAAQDRYDVAYAPTPPAKVTTLPQDFRDLIDTVKDLEEHGVFFTGDEKVTLKLATQDPTGAFAGKAWEALLTLVDYVRAKRDGVHGTNVKEYLKSTPPGYRGWSLNAYAETETGATMERYGHLRNLPVPPEHFDGATRALMPAHFKLPRLGIVTPRVHYLDHTGISGLIFVGHIGPHLRSPESN